MKKILIFTGSNSSTSINRALAGYLKTQIKNHVVTMLDLRDYPLPIYSQDIQKGEGIPENAHKLKTVFDEHDAFIITLPEHNSSLPAFFKNTIDWLSRIDMPFFQNKPVLLFGTSPGRGGAKTSLAHGEKVLGGYLSGKILSTLPIPKYRDTFNTLDDGSIEIKNEVIEGEIRERIALLEDALA